MREILFRGKSKAKGEQWIYGDLLLYADTAQIWESGYTGKWNNIVSCDTIGQFTGLTDKNGTKIFEGDILQNNNNPKDLCRVCFGEFAVIDMDNEMDVDRVIG